MNIEQNPDKVNYYSLENNEINNNFKNFVKNIEKYENLRKYCQFLENKLTQILPDNPNDLKYEVKKKKILSFGIYKLLVDYEKLIKSCRDLTFKNGIL